MIVMVVSGLGIWDDGQVLIERQGRLLKTGDRLTEVWITSFRTDGFLKKKKLRNAGQNAVRLSHSMQEGLVWLSV